MATDPLHDANAPKGPLYMAEYVVADFLTADRLEAKAATTVSAGEDANETSDQYVLNTVFLASALFLAGIASRVGLARRAHHGPRARRVRPDRGHRQRHPTADQLARNTNTLMPGQATWPTSLSAIA